MNDFKENFNKAMEQLSTDRDVVSSAKIRAEAETAGRPQRKMSAKRILGTAAAVCGVLICGVTAAGAAGLIDFDAVFGGRISVNDTELASSLVSTVNNFKYKVSDKDYKIEIKGVTGDDKNVLAIAEISRVDGTPVIDCFVNPTDEGQLVPLWENADIPDNMRASGYSIDHRVNKEGNIEIYIDFGSVGGIDGKTIAYKGKNFYPAGAYHKFKSEKNVEYLRPKSESVYTGYAQYDENGEIKSESITPADVDDSGVIALDMEYEFSFTYTASDKSQQVKSLDAPEESFPFILDVRRLKTKEDFVIELTAQPSYIEVGSTGGRIDFKYEDTGYENDLNYYVNDYENAEIYIILKNGERIYGKFSTGVGYPDDDGTYKCSYNISYWDENSYTSVFTDVENITAVSVNGVVYELN